MYQYNADGFVTQKQTTEKISNVEYKTTTTYQYEGGRLTKQTEAFGSSTPKTDNYSYDASGKLTRYETPTITCSFTNGVLTGRLSKSTGKADVVTEGRITSSFLFNDGKQDWYFHFVYNAAGQMQKFYYGDAKGVDLNLEYAYQYEYTSQSPKAAAPPALKGHPLIELYGKTGYISREVATAPKANKARDYVVDYQYKTNSKGYLTETVQTITGYQPGQTKTVYTYSNCQ